MLWTNRQTDRQTHKTKSICHIDFYVIRYALVDIIAAYTHFKQQGWNIMVWRCVIRFWKLLQYISQRTVRSAVVVRDEFKTSVCNLMPGFDNLLFCVCQTVYFSCNISQVKEFIRLIKATGPLQIYTIISRVTNPHLRSLNVWSLF